MHPKSGKIYFTYNAIEKLPEWPDGPLLEIIDGDLFMVPSPSIKHKEISLNTAILLKKHIESENLGRILVAPVDVLLSEDNLVVPDIIFIKKDREQTILEKNIQGIPDLVIEILSTNKKRDLKDKKELYEEFKLKEYWILDPDDEELILYKMDEKRQVFHKPKVYKKADEIPSEVLPGLKITCMDIFR